MACKCGSTKHKRIGHSSCPLNPKKQKGCASNNSEDHDISPRTPLPELPTEIKCNIIRIVALTTAKDLFALSAVNRQWRQLCVREVKRLSADLKYPTVTDNRVLKAFYSRRIRSCHKCGRKTARVSAFLPDVLFCMQCENSDPAYQKITKTRALSEYLLTEAALCTVPYIVAKNPHYRSAAPMNLFLVADVERVAHAVHGSKEALEAVQEERRTKRTERAENKTSFFERRRTELESEFLLNGLDIRADSKVCKEYLAKKSCRWSLNDVIRLVKKAHYLYQHTDYPSQLQSLTARRRRPYRYDNYWSDEYDSDDYVYTQEDIDSLQHECLYRLYESSLFPFIASEVCSRCGLATFRSSAKGNTSPFNGFKFPILVKRSNEKEAAKMEREFLDTLQNNFELFTSAYSATCKQNCETE
jgi:hypothetical protein